MIRLENVRKTWDGGTTFAVDGICWQASAGTVTALLGGSGCGKSTTVKMINRLIEPTSGLIEIDGQDIGNLDPVQLRRRIGYVFQGIGLFPHMTVFENVATVPKLLGTPASEYREKVNSLLEMVHLPTNEFGDRLPNQLSGGQRQRVGFARALAASPKIMLLDEPFGALDPVTRDALQSEFRQLQRSLQLTAVIVTHDMAEALLLADQILVMQGGKIIRSGSPGELLNDPGHEYVAQLLETPRRHSQLLRTLEANGLSTP
ncbi:MAG: ATP-binding cassette domain-containing protein [Pirellulaceae bacterium]